MVEAQDVVDGICEHCELSHTPCPVTIGNGAFDQMSSPLGSNDDACAEAGNTGAKLNGNLSQVSVYSVVPFVRLAGTPVGIVCFLYVISFINIGGFFPMSVETMRYFLDIRTGN